MRTRSRCPGSMRPPRLESGSGSGVALAAPTATGTLPLVTSRLYQPRTLLLTGMIFVLVGAALGWSARPPDLPGGNLVARRPPGLAIEPRWALIPRQDSGEEQYRYAQLRAAGLDLVAAWLAVPGFHSHSPEWMSPAYLQLARRLYRQGDQDRLSAFKAAFVAWQAAKTPDQELARIIDCALELLSKDLDGVIDGMARIAGPDERARAGRAMSPTSTILGCSSSAWRFSPMPSSWLPSRALRPRRSGRESWSGSRIDWSAI